MTQSPPGADPGDPFNFPLQELHRDGGLLLEALAHMRASGELILGEGVRRFEQAFGSWLAAGSDPPAVIGVANGTDALELALRCSGLGSGDRVLLPAHTAYATVAAVLRLGAEPVFVDVEPDVPLLSVAHLEALLAGEDLRRRPARALIAVHLYGAACDLDALSALCERHDLTLIEDCAQACGTLVGGRPVGTRGRFGAFSFYPTKNLAAFGDGGALVVNRPEDAELARRSRCYGWDGSRQAVQFGVNSRLDELQAWVLLGKLAHLEARIAQRRQVAAWYDARLDAASPSPGTVRRGGTAITSTWSRCRKGIAMPCWPPVVRPGCPWPCTTPRPATSIPT
ncbi:DegT/DnrJ/EryC1/StrS aminotransferase family protein [Synechococcus sp. 1G10]|uniref:DegT/DnrJ/EryC1/StrS family aminotransferase n=1 Tax=Synechococcus sp. 1G10 TaxID=2025605 RepID=UPI000B9838EC|nr:DegT/DnrJ/EryC1/StrS family aminotransferase [Synechococcus sp. 1G10]